MSANHQSIRVLASVFLLFSLGTIVSAGNTKTDSLYSVLKTSGQDTNRVKALNYLSYEELIIGEYANARKHAEEAEGLAVKLNFQPGTIKALLNSGNVDRYEGKFESAIERYNTAAKLAEEIDLKEFIASAKLNLATVYYEKGMYAKAKELSLISLTIQQKLGNKLKIANSYTSLANISKDQGDKSAALQYYFEALEIYSKLSHKMGQSVCYNGIALLYIDNFDKRIAYHERALKIDRESGDRSGVVADLINLGNGYNDQREFEKALSFYREALVIVMELGEELNVVKCKLNIAGIFSEMGNIKAAELNYRELIPIAMKNDYRSVLPAIYSGLGENYLKAGRFNLARNSTDTSMKLAKEIGETERILQCQLNFVRIDSAQGNYKSAFKNYKLYAFLKDSIESLIDKRKFAQLEMTYEFSKKEDSLRYVQMTTDNKLRQQVLITSKQRTANNYLIAALGLTLVLSFFVYMNYRTKQQLKIQALRNKIASDLHDDIGSTLSSISIFSQIARDRSEDVAPMVEKIGEYSRSMLDAMADIVWTINPENDQFEKIILRMRNFAYELLGARQIEFDFRADDVSGLKIPMEARKNLYLIFKEATNNMVKYSGAKEARFAIHREKDLLTMMIRDNGKGFDTSAVAAGNGLKNMKKRAMEIGALLLIDSIPGSGTTIKMELKL